MDFKEDSTLTNSSNVEDDDVEVKHTIVVSTKLKNNRKGLHTNDGKIDSSIVYLTLSIIMYLVREHGRSCGYWYEVSVWDELFMQKIALTTIQLV